MDNFQYVEKVRVNYLFGLILYVRFDIEKFNGSNIGDNKTLPELALKIMDTLPSQKVKFEDYLLLHAEIDFKITKNRKLEDSWLSQKTKHLTYYFNDLTEKSLKIFVWILEDYNFPSINLRLSKKQQIIVIKMIEKLWKKFGYCSMENVFFLNRMYELGTLYIF